MTRLLSALVLGPLVLYAVYKGGMILSGLVLLASLAGCVELESMLKRKGIHVVRPVAMLGSVLIVIAFVSGRLDVVMPAMVISGLVSIALPVFFPSRLTALDAVGTVFVLFYVPVMLGHLLLLRAGSVWFLAIMLASTWCCDVLAYFVGKAIGRHKLCPAISPGKSWEGAIAGFLASTAAVGVLSYYTSIPVGQSVLIGAVLGVSGQVGDLAESALKRFAGVKDSGSLIPGHGGVLDRCDSLLYNGPVLYYTLLLMQRIGG